MRKNFKPILQITAFLIGFVIIWIGLTVIFQPKYYYSTEYSSPETEIWHDFYHQSKDSIDVLYVGSSHVYNGIVPEVIREKTGLVGFDMACSNQDMRNSYTYIQEALRYQSPKYIVLDSFYLQYDVFTMDNFKRAHDDMRWSPIKWEALSGYFEHTVGEKRSYRILTLLDFHKRWESLVKEDFDRSYETSQMGFIPLGDIGGCEREKYYYNDEPMNIPPRTIDYFDCINELCKANNMKLVLVSIPSSYWTRGYCNSAKLFAEEKGIPYIELNSDDEYKIMRLDMNTDFRNLDHLNTTGAIKLSERLAEYMEQLGMK